jgi:hypothetical protein
MSNGGDPRCAYIAKTASAMFNAPNLEQQIAAAQETVQFVNELGHKVL